MTCFLRVEETLLSLVVAFNTHFFRSEIFQSDHLVMLGLFDPHDTLKSQRLLIYEAKPPPPLQYLLSPHRAITK